jgi:quercetin dioxygenase-like cupin family protein
VGDLARHFDLPPARVRELLRLTDSEAAWQPSPMPGVRLIDFPSGPGAIASHAGFVTFPKGLEFPYHRHLGPEMNYVLHGSMLGDDGHLYIPGEVLAMPADSAHAFSFPDTDTLIAVVHLGFEFIDKPR